MLMRWKFREHANCSGRSKKTEQDGLSSPLARDLSFLDGFKSWPSLNQSTSLLLKKCKMVGGSTCFGTNSCTNLAKGSLILKGI